MTTKIKNVNAIKTLITSALEAASYTADDLKITKTGEVTLTIANSASTPKTPASKVEVPSSLEFAYGERTKLKAAYAKDYGDIEGLQRNHFGRVTEVKGTKVLIVGVKEGKVLVRKEDGKRSKISAKTIIKALESTNVKAQVASSTSTDTVTEPRPTAQKPKTWTMVKAKVPGTKLDAETSSELQAKFKAVSAKRDIDFKFKQAFQKGDVKAQLVGIVNGGTKLRLYVPKTQKFVRVALDNVSA